MSSYNNCAWVIELNKKLNDADEDCRFHNFCLHLRSCTLSVLAIKTRYSYLYLYLRVLVLVTSLTHTAPQLYIGRNLTKRLPLLHHCRNVSERQRCRPFDMTDSTTAILSLTFECSVKSVHINDATAHKGITTQQTSSDTAVQWRILFVIVNNKL